MSTRIAPHDWRTSSYTTTTNCVEVALTPDVVAVRDTKDRHGPVLTFSAAAFSEFLAGVKER
ncbi:DUF397 domain-containing protein [Saccharopolyspora dendranthemae]|uniref:Uncharacterized protein DUF397 n=1 Tax=Saccharopolyspora dendranthemae TaxID=1181886 RepID=A0A561U2Z5_9PSEU|nr:DUF397 domain-containing protein [Saccharopolyspora dendranthemae]TWF93710.1 uncharacterized protein DUF397 [Saccharopolyspora dendranthemae]